MRRLFRSGVLLILSLVLWLPDVQVKAFSLIGPYEDWMDVTNSFRQPGDIGGPMDISAGYRWNVPLVTYGFDQSFLEYFGSNGVAAVEAAIKILNDLPNASRLELTNYPDSTERINYSASAQNLWDLKSAAVAALVEQIGLAQPVRFVFSIRRWDSILEQFVTTQNSVLNDTNLMPDLVIERNYDSQTLLATYVVNGTEYSGYVVYPDLANNGVPTVADVREFQIDPLQQSYTAVADGVFNGGPQLGAFGMFYTDLTYDDVGGIKFLLSSNNVNVESLLPSVQPANQNSPLIRTALRPGVEKIAFLSHPHDTAESLSTVHQFLHRHFHHK